MMSNVTKVCQKCNSTSTLKCVLPHGSAHYGQIVCRQCGQWLRWMPDPDITREFDIRKLIIKEALKCDRVTSWERFFLKSIEDRRFLTSKQEGKYRQICDRHHLSARVV